MSVVFRFAERSFEQVIVLVARCSRSVGGGGGGAAAAIAALGIVTLAVACFPSIFYIQRSEEDMLTGPSTWRFKDHRSTLALDTNFRAVSLFCVPAVNVQKMVVYASCAVLYPGGRRGNSISLTPHELQRHLVGQATRV